MLDGTYLLDKQDAVGDQYTHNITQHLAALSHSSGQQLAIAIQKAKINGYQYKEISFGELEELSNNVAKGLMSIGMKKGVRTILMVKPSVEFFVLSFALMKVGAVTVMIDPGMGIKNLKACIDEVDAHIFIGSLKAHFARALLSWGKNSLKKFICVAPRPLENIFSATNYSQLLQLGRDSSTPFRLYDFQPNDLAAILFTSGSTGPPKGVEYTHAMFAAQVTALRDHYQVSSGERDLATFPSFALFGPALGIASIIPDMDASRPMTANPKHILDAVDRYQCSNMFVSPALIDKLGSFHDKSLSSKQLSSLNRIISAGAPARHDSIRKFRQLLTDQCQLHPSYGATESLPLASIESIELLDTQTLTDSGHGVCVGYPLAGVDIKVITISNDPIARWHQVTLCTKHEIGEIVACADVVSRHYFRQNKADQLSKIAKDDGSFYHRMGDLGYFDETGRLWMCGRKQHRVESNSGTLFSISCERIFDSHPLIKRTALVGIPAADNQYKTAVICIETQRKLSSSEKRELVTKLLLRAKSYPITASIDQFLFHRQFPVDVRHNAKIIREQLAIWANMTLAKKLKPPL